MILAWLGKRFPMEERKRKSKKSNHNNAPKYLNKTDPEYWARPRPTHYRGPTSHTEETMTLHTVQSIQSSIKAVFFFFFWHFSNRRECNRSEGLIIIPSFWAVDLRWLSWPGTWSSSKTALYAASPCSATH